MDLTLDQLKESAAHIVRRIPASDDRKKRAVDVPSEFLSPLYSCVSQRLVSYASQSHIHLVRRGTSAKSYSESPGRRATMVSRAICKIFSADSEIGYTVFQPGPYAFEENGSSGSLAIFRLCSILQAEYLKIAVDISLQNTVPCNKSLFLL